MGNIQEIVLWLLFTQLSFFLIPFLNCKNACLCNLISFFKNSFNFFFFIYFHGENFECFFYIVFLIEKKLNRPFSNGIKLQGHVFREFKTGLKKINEVMNNHKEISRIFPHRVYMVFECVWTLINSNGCPKPNITVHLSFPTVFIKNKYYQCFCIIHLMYQSELVCITFLIIFNTLNKLF